MTSRSDPEGTKTSARTPGPWAVGNKVYVYRRPDDDANAKGFRVGLATSKRDQADAAFIVTACNAYDADRALIASLADALRELLAIHERQFATLPAAPDSNAWQTAKARLDRARAALSRAEKEGA